MVLIFSLQRPDVVSFGDLAIHRGLRMIYRHRTIDRATLRALPPQICALRLPRVALPVGPVAGGACGLNDPAERKPKSRRT